MFRRSEAELRELMHMDVDIKKAEEKIEYLGSNPKTLELYKARERSLHERANMISSAQEEKAIKIAKKMMSKGYSLEDIADMTELTLDEIMKIN
jgi:SOS response regulatory protein OraA/RecX